MLGTAFSVYIASLPYAHDDQIHFYSWIIKTPNVLLQVLLPLLETDLYDVMMQCVTGSLTEVTFSADRVAVAVVAVSNGYPGSYKKGLPITGGCVP